MSNCKGLSLRASHALLQGFAQQAQCSPNSSRGTEPNVMPCQNKFLPCQNKALAKTCHCRTASVLPTTRHTKESVNFSFRAGKTVAAPRLGEKEKLPGHRSTAEITCLQKVSPRHPQVTEQNCCTRVKLDQVSSAKAQMPREPRIQRACRQVPASSFTALMPTLKNSKLW